MYNFYGKPKEDKTLMLYLGQGDESIYGFDLISRKIRIPDDIFTTLLHQNENLFSIALLVKTDIDITKVVEVKTVLFSTTIDEKELARIKTENKVIAERFKNNTSIKKFLDIPDDVFIPKNTWNFILSSFDFGLYPLLLGPKGCGKTTLSYTIAKTLGYTFYKIDCGTLFKPKAALVGQTQAQDGTTYLVESKFLKLFGSDEKVLIFLDEISRIPSQASNYMMTILDATNPYIYIEEQAKEIQKGKNVIFIAAGNFGPEYVDARVLDGALDDRFVKFYLDFLSEFEELGLVKAKLKKTSPENKILDITILNIIRKANLIREGVRNKDIMTNISTRKVMQMSYYLLNGFSTGEIINTVMRNLFVHDENELEYFDKVLDSQP